MHFSIFVASGSCIAAIRIPSTVPFCFELVALPTLLLGTVSVTHTTEEPLCGGIFFLSWRCVLTARLAQTYFLRNFTNKVQRVAENVSSLLSLGGG